MKRFVARLLVVMLMFSCLGPSSNARAEEISALSDIQRNSIGVLNYLAYLTKEIENQKGNRLYLESAYTSLYNNIYINGIDAATLEQVKGLLTVLNGFKMIAAKRERLEYIYEQNQAQAIKNAIPNPLDIRNIVQSNSWQQALISVVYMAVESAVNYYVGIGEIDLSYLQSGWELDDEEADILHREHLDSLDYIWEIIHAYDLPSDLAINEDDIERFVSWKNNENLVARIQFLESNQSVYQAFGEYWLVLAESYYFHGDMEKCLEAINCYETYSTRIFRKDYHYAKVLSMAIGAAKEVYEEREYITEADRFCTRIITNCDQEDWALRYFAALTYAELAGRTSDDSYLKKAYDIILNNVNYLVPKQTDSNKEYMSEVKTEQIPAGLSKAKRMEIEAYNKGLREARKTALPPLSDALILNCDLLFMLAEQLHISEAEKAKISGILYGHGTALFLNPLIDALYHYDAIPQTDVSQIDIVFTGKTIKLPAYYLTEKTAISVGGIDASGRIFTIDDWGVESVERRKSEDITSFTATYVSKKASDFKYAEGTTVWIDLNPAGDEHTKEMQFLFSVVSKTDFLIPYLTFQRTE